MKSEIIDMKLETDLGLPVPEKKKKKRLGHAISHVLAPCVH